MIEITHQRRARLRTRHVPGWATHVDVDHGGAGCFGNASTLGHPAPFAAGKLYDMTKDPGQQHDVAGAEPETAGRLRDAVARWRRDVLSELKREDRPFTVDTRRGS